MNSQNSNEENIEEQVLLSFDIKQIASEFENTDYEKVSDFEISRIVTIGDKSYLESVIKKVYNIDKKDKRWDDHAGMVMQILANAIEDILGMPITVKWLNNDEYGVIDTQETEGEEIDYGSV